MRKNLFTGLFGAFLSVVLAAPACLAEDTKADSANEDKQQQSEESKNDDESKTEEQLEEAKKEAKETADEAKDKAEEAADEVKDEAKDAKEAAKDAVKDDDAKDKDEDAEDRAEEREATREEIRQERQEAREAIREHRQQAREEMQDARDQVQDTRQDQRDARQETREDNQADRQQPREDARETRQETREAVRDERQDARSNIAEERRSFFRGRTGPNLGVRFDEGREARRLSIMQLDRGGLGARLGLRRGDVIVSMNGRQFQNSDEFGQAWQNPNARGNALVIERNGEQFTMQLPDWTAQNDQQQRDRSPAENGGRGVLGVSFDPSYREVAVILEVQSGSAAEKIGLKQGDMLKRIDGEEVRSLRHALNLIRSMPAGEEFEIEYSRPQKETVSVALDGVENQVR